MSHFAIFYLIISSQIVFCDPNMLLIVSPTFKDG